MSEPNTCLTCRFLSEPNEPHRFHECCWLYSNPIPIAMADHDMVSVNIKYPFKNCPCWQQRAVQE